MAKIVWDTDGQKYYETGTRNVVLYPKSSTGTYPNGVAWNGVTAVTESPSGAESNPLYADDVKYIDLRSAEEFGGTIEAYTYPDEFAECDGSAEIVSGLKVGQQSRKSFGLCFTTVKGNDVDFNDAGDRRFSPLIQLRYLQELKEHSVSLFLRTIFMERILAPVVAQIQQAQNLSFRHRRLLSAFSMEP